MKMRVDDASKAVRLMSRLVNSIRILGKTIKEEDCNRTALAIDSKTGKFVMVCAEYEMKDIKYVFKNIPNMIITGCYISRYNPSTNLYKDELVPCVCNNPYLIHLGTATTKYSKGEDSIELKIDSNFKGVMVYSIDFIADTVTVAIDGDGALGEVSQVYTTDEFIKTFLKIHNVAGMY